MSAHVSVTGPLFHSTRVEATTINKIVRKLTEPAMRDRRLLNLLKSAGRITFNNTGPAIQWSVRKRKNKPQPHGDMQPVPKQRTNYTFNVGLPWRSFIVGESTSKGERLAIGSGPEAVVKVLPMILGSLTEGMTDELSEQLYGDGNATTTDIHGFASWTSAAAGTNGAGTGTANDNYAGQSTALANLGGTWTGTWPSGNGDDEYDCFTPLVVDYTHTTKWEASTKTWRYTWREAVRFAAHHLFRLHGKKLDFIIVDSDMYQDCENSVEDKERIIVEGQKDLDLGYPTIRQSGVKIMTDYHAPADKGWGVILSELELMSQQPQLFVRDEGEDWDIQLETTYLDFFGNMKISTPAYFVSFQALGGT